MFILSLDLELIWGTLDLFGEEGFRTACERERALIPRLLDLLAEFGISATWCVVGHLMLDRCTPVSGVKHPEIVRPKHAWVRGDWFDHDPCTSEAESPLFYGRSLVDRIRECAVEQEIGCHTFSHVILGDRGCSHEAAESDVVACGSAAKALGIVLRSFVFPRNQVGHLEVLRKHGFSAYRGPGQWYEREGSWALAGRLAHLWDVLRAATPPTSLPEETLPGLWNVPGSMIYFPAHGLRRFIPISARVRRACRGLDAAAREKRVFQLWFHPFNLADETEAMFAGLRQIFEHTANLRAAQRLEVKTLGSLVAQFS